MRTDRKGRRPGNRLARRSRNLESDCIALLAYVAAHRDEAQTYLGLAHATGIPYETVRQMVMWHKKDPNNWALRNYGSKFGYVVRYLGQPEYPREWRLTVARVVRKDRIGVSLSLRGGRMRRIARFGAAPEALDFIRSADARLDLLERKIIDVVQVGMSQDEDGKLFVDDVPEYHALRESQELRPDLEAAEP